MVETTYSTIILSLEILGIVIIIVGILKMLYRFIQCMIYRIKIVSIMTEIRLELSNYLILSLEIFIGRDIIETFLNPSLNDIIVLVVLVLLRTLLAFFLNYEMKHLDTQDLDKVLKNKPARNA